MADNDWDAENFEPGFVAGTGAGKWEGEDEDDDVKESWEDFEEEEKDTNEKESESKSEEAQPVKVPKKKNLKEIIAEKEEKKRKDNEQKLKQEAANELRTPQDELDEKLRQQRLQEESDLELALDTFGSKNNVKYGFESMQPSSKEDFDVFRKALIETITRNEKSSFYLTFLDDFLRELCINMESDDIKKLGNTLQVLANEKLKATKQATKGKKKGGKAKASLVTGKQTDYTDYGADYEGEFDDFM